MIHGLKPRNAASITSLTIRQINHRVGDHYFCKPIGDFLSRLGIGNPLFLSRRKPMHKFVSAQSDLEHLLVELAYCVNDLQGFRLQMSLEDAKQAELSLSKLDALISLVKNQGNAFRLAAV
jgi:hypothetical protein